VGTGSWFSPSAVIGGGVDCAKEGSLSGTRQVPPTDAVHTDEHGAGDWSVENCRQRSAARASREPSNTTGACGPLVCGRSVSPGLEDPGDSVAAVPDHRGVRAWTPCHPVRTRSGTGRRCVKRQQGLGRPLIFGAFARRRRPGRARPGRRPPSCRSRLYPARMSACIAGTRLP